MFLLPWQRLFPGIIAGAVFSPGELLKISTEFSGPLGVIRQMLFYLRFVGLWLIVVLLLGFAQVRSIRWAKATLRRLEVI